MTKKTKTILVILITIAGVITGYLYWYFIGCTSGSCPITSKWYMSSLWGGIIGYLIGDMIHPHRKKDVKANDEINER
ncbi:MAG: hypothetical protein JXB49_00090 [Bacteroidales bacterium]|nr:hypothetical protein [Bacteroidales bacterium]